MEKIHRNKKGYSLVEVIVAIAILGLLSAMFSQITFSSLKARNNSRERLEAVAIATSAIDEIKSFRGNSDSGSIWKSVSHLKTQLAVDETTPGSLGYVLDPEDSTKNTFLKKKLAKPENNIESDIKIIIKEDNGIDNTFDLTVVVDSPNVTDLRMVTRIRGDKGE